MAKHPIFEKGATVVVLENLSNGGAQRVVASLLNNINPTNKIYLLVLTSNIEYQLTPNSNIEPIFINARRILFALPLLVSHIQQIKPERIFSTVFFTDMLIYWISRLLSPKSTLVFRSCNYFSKKYPNRFDLVRKLVLTAYKNANTVICSTQQMQQDYWELDSRFKDKTIVIPNPVDVEQVRNQSKLADTSSNDLSVDHYFNESSPTPANTYTFVCVAKLKPQKNLTLLIRALAKTQSNCRLILIGKGPQEAYLKALVDSLGLSSRVSFIGFLANPYPVVKLADALVLSSDFEGFPNVILEAMALGLPIISTRCPSGPDEILIHERNGLLIPVNNKQALSDSMDRLVNEPQLVVEMSNNNLEDVKKFNVKQIAPLFERQLLGVNQ